MWEYRFVDTVCPLVAPKNFSVPFALFNKADNVRMEHGGSFVQPLLLWKAMSITQPECVYM
jgi:hypothetical protein